MKKIGTLEFSKELFTETMNEIKKQHIHDSKCSEAFKTILPYDYISGYKNIHLHNQLIKLLKLAMNDNHYSWIEYYIYDLEFGEKYTKGSVRVKNKDFELKTPEDLWELLNIV